jgi:hypothetical protein
MIEFVTQGPRYAGPERRKSERRRRGDRREEIRFEPDKDDRRSGKDRRTTGSWDRTPRRD